MTNETIGDDIASPEADQHQLPRVTENLARNTAWISPLVHGVLAFLVAAPLLRGGYLMLLDFVFGPQVPVQWRTTQGSSMPPNLAPFQAALWLISKAGPFAGFLFVFVLVFALGFAMNRLVATYAPESHVAARIVAGTLYAINPFTYTRLIHGQMNVLVGMVLIPLVLIAQSRLSAEPSLRRALLFGASVAAVGFAGLHALAMLFLVVPVFMLLLPWPGMRQLIVAAGVAVGLSSWWLLQIGAYRAPGITSLDLQLFATRPVGITSAGHVAALYGFWRTEEFRLPRDDMWAWPVFFLPIAAAVVWGLVEWWRKKPRYAAALGGLGVVSIIIACGVSFPPTAGMFRWTYAHVPGASLFREPQKWVAVTLLAYGLLAALAIDRVVRTLDPGRVKRRRRSGVYPEVMATIMVGVVLFYGRTMLLNQSALRPSSYPKDWYTANTVMKQDAGRALVFPWHLYMTFPFTHHRIANPASAFFDVPVISSDSIELGPVRTETANPQSIAVERILFGPSSRSALDSTLSALCVRWVVLYKVLDWESYAWLDSDHGLKRAFDGHTIRVYSVTHMGDSGCPTAGNDT